MTDQGTYRLVGRGSDLGIEVAGPDLAACLRAAVEGFAAAVGDVPEGTGLRAEEVAFDEDAPEHLLVELLDDAIARLDADGELAVDLEVDAADGGRLRGRLLVCDVDRVDVRGVAPKAATWHDVALEPTRDGWVGRIMLDL